MEALRVRGCSASCSMRCSASCSTCCSTGRCSMCCSACCSLRCSACCSTGRCSASCSMCCRVRCSMRCSTCCSVRCSPPCCSTCCSACCRARKKSDCEHFYNKTKKTKKSLHLAIFFGFSFKLDLPKLDYVQILFIKSHTFPYFYSQILLVGLEHTGCPLKHDTPKHFLSMKYSIHPNYSKYRVFFFTGPP